MTSRPLNSSDIPMLEQALVADEFPHSSSRYYMEDKSYSEVYENDNGPVGVLRYSKALRLVAVFRDNSPSVQNAKTVIKMITDAVKRAKDSGFSEIIFNTQSPALAKFCVDKLNFVESKGEYVRAV